MLSVCCLLLSHRKPGKPALPAITSPRAARLSLSQHFWWAYGERSLLVGSLPTHPKLRRWVRVAPERRRGACCKEETGDRCMEEIGPAATQHDLGPTELPRIMQTLGTGRAHEKHSSYSRPGAHESVSLQLVRVPAGANRNKEARVGHFVRLAFSEPNPL